jgi:hypothetical protein
MPWQCRNSLRAADAVGGTDAFFHVDSVVISRRKFVSHPSVHAPQSYLHKWAVNDKTRRSGLICRRAPALLRAGHSTASGYGGAFAHITLDRGKWKTEVYACFSDRAILLCCSLGECLLMGL